MPDKPNFALLIGKKKDDGPMSPSMDDHADDLQGADGMSSRGAEDSAAKDIVSAVKSGNHELLKAALKDFIEICYPDMQGAMGDEESSEPADEAKAEGDDGSGGY